jgi:hypothetical protein
MAKHNMKETKKDSTLRGNAANLRFFIFVAIPGNHALHPVFHIVLWNKAKRTN